jgi:hypothetical protein
MLLLNLKRANRPEVREEILPVAHPLQGGDWLAWGRGLEPRLAQLKCAIPPLDDPPMPLRRRPPLNRR